MIRNLIIAFLLVAAATGGYLAQRAWNAAAPPAAPERTIDFTLPDLQGQAHSLADWRGKALLVNFWATWCAPCRREIPLLKATQAEHGADGVQVVGVAVDYAGEVAAYAEGADFNYPVLVGQEEAIAAAESAGVEFIGLPFTLLITADGRMVKAHMGELHARELDEIVRVLKALGAGETDMAAARDALGRF